MPLRRISQWIYTIHVDGFADGDWERDKCRLYFGIPMCTGWADPWFIWSIVDFYGECYSDTSTSFQTKGKFIGTIETMEYTRDAEDMEKAPTTRRDRILNKGYVVEGLYSN